MIARGTVVELFGGHTPRRGVVVADTYGVCADWEVPVVWYGSDGYSGTNEDSLTVIGPDPAIADLEKCGGGTERCCAFLTMDHDGFRCARFTALREVILMRVLQGTMNATRVPTGEFPGCQTE